MRALTTLNPQFVGFTRADSGEQLLLDCPVCGPRHRMAIAFANPLDGKPAAMWPSQVWWTREGETFETLTLTASTDKRNGHGASVQYPCFHGWIEGGQVIAVAEATHAAELRDPTTGAVKHAFLSPRQVEALRAAGRIA